MLKAMGDGLRKAHIVHKVNLNFENCGRYLNEMRKAGLVEIRMGSPMMWAITEKGRAFLKKYRGLRDPSIS